ncbi:MAG: ABC transporter ATP-binding protein [Candidatus Omnitrophota bacterium]
MQPKAEKTGSIYRRLLRYIQPHWWRLGISSASMVGYSLTMAVASVIPYATINGLSNKKEVVISSATIPHLPFDIDIRFPVFWIPILIFAVIGFRSLFEYVSQYQMASVGIRAIRKIREDLYAHLVYLSSDFYSRGRTGDFLSRITNDVTSVQGAVTDVLTDLVKQPLVILFLIPSVFIWGGPGGIIALIVFPLVAVPIAILGKRLRRTTRTMHERSADITAFIGETLTGIHIVKAFNREEAEISRFNRINHGVFDFFKKTIRITIVQRPLIDVLAAGGAGLAIWFSIDSFTPERFTSFIASLFLLYEPLKKLSKVNSTIQQSLASGGRIFEILDEIPSIRDREGACAFQGKVERIEFEKVSFEYAAGRRVLEGIDLQIKAGEVFAFVGPSGAGKTTLVHLIPRFYDPTLGVIRINGTDIRDLTIRSLRGLIGMVSQDTILFNATIRENIAYGRPEASPEEVRKAAEAAFAHEFIESLPQGYDTPIGERGLKLSGGQRQRLAIARAILKDAPILILDEATSHLDTESEREVQKALENLMKGRTVFVIAHRLSTVQRADKILVMDEGRIVQRGTNEALISQGGIYKKLHDLQFNL